MLPVLRSPYRKPLEAGARPVHPILGPQRFDFAVVQNTALQGKLRIDSTYGYKEIEVQIIGRLGADFEEKHEPVSDVDTAAADSLKVLDPKRPIREVDISRTWPKRPDMRGYFLQRRLGRLIS